MKNPTYLSQSRHGVFYFRFPITVTIKGKTVVSRPRISLETRCSRQALRLAGMLEYHTIELVKYLQGKGMEYAEIVRLVKEHWASVLRSKQEEIDRDGLLSPKMIEFNRSQIEFANGIVSGDEVEHELVFKDGSISTASQNLARKLDIKVPQDSPEYQSFVKETYYGMAWYLKELLAYNNTYRENAYSTSTIAPTVVQATVQAESVSALQIAVDEYIRNIRREQISARTKEEREDQLNLLIEMLGANYDLYQLDARGAYRIQQNLCLVPTNRNKIKATKGLPIKEQMKVADVERLSVGSVNKYLSCYGAFMKWALVRGFAHSNPFQSMSLKDSKGKKKRDHFSSKQVKTILGELAKGKAGLADTDYKYWGALILLYTGARLNEVASLTVDDVKQKDGIWYFDINDEEESKSLKTGAAKRLVPVHSELIKLDFMAFLEKSRGLRKTNERLLYELSYSSKTHWGRMLGRWFNNVFLPALELKTDRLVLHSLRHTVITGLQLTNVELPKIQALVGHEPNTVTSGTYAGGQFTLQQLKNAIECLKY
jgi:integrase